MMQLWIGPESSMSETDNTSGHQLLGTDVLVSPPCPIAAWLSERVSLPDRFPNKITRSDAVFDRILSEAQLLTNSSGAAIAVGDGNAMLCVASRGDSAPTIGASVQVRRGLSGECIRTGESVICTDAAVDARVNNEACRELGIASILYIPLRTTDGAAKGLLGLFAPYAYHFSERDFGRLQSLVSRLEVELNNVGFSEVHSGLVATDVTTAVALPVDPVKDQRVIGDDHEDPVDAPYNPEPLTLEPSRFRLHTPVLASAAVVVLVATVGWGYSKISSVGQQENATVATSQLNPTLNGTAARTAVKPTEQLASSSVPETNKYSPSRPADLSDLTSRLTIVIDPGHGGRDVGTSSVTGLHEKDLTLDIAQRLGDLLKKQLNVDVVFTRKDDSYVSLVDRANAANEARADILLSIHGNASSYDDVRGIETYYFPSSGEQSTEENNALVQSSSTTTGPDAAQEFASDVQAALLEGLTDGKQSLRDRGVKRGSFVVLKDAQMPAVLAEISFLSSSKDATRLDSAEYRERVAKALYRGVAKYVSQRKAPATVVASRNTTPSGRNE